MFIINAQISEKIELGHNIFLFKMFCPEIASSAEPGQFLNLRINETYFPLLRRPFSVCDISGDHFYILFSPFGEGTKQLAKKSVGDNIDTHGPLGKGFNYKGEYETAVIVAGGLGSAPFPFVTRKINNKKDIISFVGGRSQKDVITYGMENVSTSTDDGSEGFEGTVVDLLETKVDELKSKNVKVFGCGPTPMLKALQSFCSKNNFDCEISTECAMACGFGICQGCPIEQTEYKDQYLLVCSDGPVFNAKDVVL
ncbi:MAG: dihydroorotate dehydrogenase electron transfer subunit [Ignavibacterium sp.]|nr:MAG: dihydroorotate dehydrogenase electron transfer subunit [Ignavibacterium sp.]